jgi:hypothetical protein
VPVEGEKFTAVGKAVADDDDAFVTVPAFRLSIGYQTVSDAEDRFAKAVTAAHPPPIFPGMKLVVAGTETAEVIAARGIGSFRRIQGKIE